MYDITVQHPSSQTSWKGKFRIARADFAETMFSFCTEAMPEYIQYTATPIPPKEDTHKIRIRPTTKDKVDLLYWNSIQSFEGYQKLAEVPKDVVIKGELVEVPLPYPCRYHTDGSIRRMSKDELNRVTSESGGVLAGEPYVSQLEKTFLHDRRPKKLQAIVLAWVAEGKLHHAIIGKYRPVPPMLKVSSDASPELLMLRAKFRKYDLLQPAQVISMKEKCLKVMEVIADEDRVRARVQIEGEAKPKDIEIKLPMPLDNPTQEAHQKQSSSDSRGTVVKIIAGDGKKGG
jgi:hypothetical protein